MLELLEELSPPFQRMRLRHLSETELTTASIQLHSRLALVMTNRRLCLFRRGWLRLVADEVPLADITGFRRAGKAIQVETTRRSISLDFSPRPDLQAEFTRLLERILSRSGEEERS